MLIRPALLAVVAASAVVLVGCSSEPKIVRTPSASSSSASSAEQTSVAQSESAAEPLGAEECVDVTGAQLDIILATDSTEARVPADTLMSFGPPAPVVEAIEHFVEVGGIQFDDPDATKYTDELKAWVEQVCPV